MPRKRCAPSLWSLARPRHGGGVGTASGIMPVPTPLLDASSSGVSRVTALQDALPMVAQLARRRHIAVERRTRDAAQLPTELADCGLAALHGSLRQAHLRLRQAKGPAALAAAGACRLQPCHRAFPDQLALEFRQGRKNPEDQLATGRRGVDAGALAGQDFQADAGLRERLGGIDQMFEVASQAVELPDDERIAVPQCLQTGGEGRAVLIVPRGLVFVNVI